MLTLYEARGETYRNSIFFNFPLGLNLVQTKKLINYCLLPQEEKPDDTSGCHLSGKVYDIFYTWDKRMDPPDILSGICFFSTKPWFMTSPYLPQILDLSYNKSRKA